MMIDDEDECGEDVDGDCGDGPVAVDDGVVDDDVMAMSTATMATACPRSYKGPPRGQHDVPRGPLRRLLLVRCGE